MTVMTIPVVYLDDLLVYSESLDEHLFYLETILSRLQNHELYLGESKCGLLKIDTEFLGLHLGIEGYILGEERQRLVCDWPIPTSIREFRSFIGLIHFFRRIIRNFANVVVP